MEIQIFKATIGTRDTRQFCIGDTEVLFTKNYHQITKIKQGAPIEKADPSDQIIHIRDISGYQKGLLYSLTIYLNDGKDTFCINTFRQNSIIYALEVRRRALLQAEKAIATTQESGGSYNYSPVRDTYKPPMPTAILPCAILFTLLLCCPFCIVSIYYAAQIRGLYRVGNYREALRKADLAKAWIVIPVPIWLIILIGPVYFLNVIVIFFLCQLIPEWPKKVEI